MPNPEMVAAARRLAAAGKTQRQVDAKLDVMDFCTLKDTAISGGQICRMLVAATWPSSRSTSGR